MSCRPAVAPTLPESHHAVSCAGLHRICQCNTTMLASAEAQISCAHHAYVHANACMYRNSQAVGRYALQCARAEPATGHEMFWESESVQVPAREAGMATVRTLFFCPVPHDTGHLSTCAYTSIYTKTGA